MKKKNMSKQAFGTTGIYSVSLTRDNTILKDIKTIDLDKFSEHLLSIVNETLTNNISNKVLNDIFKFLHLPKVKGDGKNEKMKNIITMHLENEHEKVKKKIESYKKRQRIKIRREILNIIDIFTITNDLLTTDLKKLSY